jgi:hypothetical protein
MEEMKAVVAGVVVVAAGVVGGTSSRVREQGRRGRG